MTADLYERALDYVDRRVRRATARMGAWGEVTSTSPLKVKFSGVGSAVTVDQAEGLTLSVGDRVAVDRRGRQWLVAYVIEAAS